MVISAIRLAFQVSPGGESPKALAQKIKDRVWSKFRASVAEVPSPGSSEIVIGISLVGSDEKQVRDRSDKLIRDLRDWTETELISDETEVIRYADIEAERDFEKFNP
ncbi:MAG: DUF503 family protein [Oligoflexia bacterium]|nr:DUF503 family protein [Oligoflexia bacterium]